MQEYDDEYAGDGHDGEYEEGDGEEYGGAIALSLAVRLFVVMLPHCCGN